MRKRRLSEVQGPSPMSSVTERWFFFFRNLNSYIDYIKLSQDTILINLIYFRADMLVQLRSVVRQSGVLELD
jgi:hypothetical protein